MTKKKKLSNENKKDSGEAAGGCARKNQIRFKSLLDIRRFMARILNDLDADNISDSKAKTLGYLCSVLRDIIKDSELESRILKLEREMNKNE
jgi:hypothetical protein